MNIKQVILTDKEGNNLHIYNCNNTTRNLFTGKSIKQSRSEFNKWLNELKSDYNIYIMPHLKTGEYININTGKIEKLFGIE